MSFPPEGARVTDYRGKVVAWVKDLGWAITFTERLADEHTIEYYTDGKWRPFARYHTGNLKWIDRLIDGKGMEVTHE